MTTKIICVGGPHSGKRVGVEFETYEFPRDPLFKMSEDGSRSVRNVDVYVLRKLRAHSGHTTAVYVYEHDVHRDFTELVLSELGRVTA